MVARLTARPKLVIPFAELSSFELRSFSRIPRAIRRPLSCKGGFLHGQICTISGLGTPLLTKTDEFSENFQRGGGSFPIKNVFCRFFGNFEGENDEFFEEKKKGEGSKI